MAKQANYTPEQLEKARKARNEYLRKWRAANPEKVREQRLRHWLRKAEVLK